MHIKKSRLLIAITAFLLIALSACKGLTQPIELTINFDSKGGTLVESITYDGEQVITFPENPTREGYTFSGWYWDNETFEKPFTANSLLGESIQKDITVYAKWSGTKDPILMVQVGELGTAYTVPVGISKTASIEGGFFMATTETTYKLWYDVRIWAIDNGYHFQNQGREGSDGSFGEAPSTSHQHPVTWISWFSTIVWLNAMSEMYDLEPVYRDAQDNIFRDGRNTNIDVIEQMVITNHNGYRLPTIDEWEMAARWRNSEGNDAIVVGDKYWSPWNYASGAEGPARDPENPTATRAVAWYSGAPGGNFTRSVGLLMPNDLGIYDMSGNVWEWTVNRNSFGNSIARGASYYEEIGSLAIGFSSVFNTDPASGWSIIGFRIVRNG